MSRKEEIHQYIISQLITANLGFNKEVFVSHNKPVKGDVVYCVTNPTHPWAIAIYDGSDKGVGAFGSEKFHLLELGTNRLGYVENEMLYVIKGLNPLQLIDETRNNLLLKIKRTMRKYGDDWHIFGGIEFHPEPGKVGVVVRHPYCGSPLSKCEVNGKKQYTTPYTVVLETGDNWGKRLSMKKIAEAMMAQGWTKREFPLEEREYDPITGNVVSMAFLG